MSDHPPYLAGLRLAGRRVVVVGGGQVAQRRVPTLIAAGADVVVVAPELTPALEGMAHELTWHGREFVAADLDGAWYAVAATDSAQVNAAVGAAAEERRVFCVRSDDAAEATAWTPAQGRYDDIGVAVLANRAPRRSAALRDAVVDGLRDGSLDPGPRAAVAAGEVVLVGGGPGDPTLVSLAARDALASADVVVADRLAPRELLDQLPADVEVVDVAKLPRGRHVKQEQINATLVEHARAGRRVVRFKGGDGFVFGRGFEEILACREAGVPVSVVPGLSSALAVPARLGIPVTHRGVAHDFTVISGHLPPDHPDSLVEWPAVARLRGTLVLMMAVENSPAIAEVLLVHGRDPEEPVAVVVEGTMPTERLVVTTLAGLAGGVEALGIRPPAIIVVGPVVAVAHP